jgi:hypothetical protein
MLKNLFTMQITFIIIDIVLGSLMAFLGILAYGKIKKASGLFFVLTSLCLYLGMIFRVLESLNIFFLKDITFYKIPVYYYMLSDFPYIFMILGFIFMMLDNKS